MDRGETDYSPKSRWRFRITTDDVTKYPPPHMNPWLRLAIYILITFQCGCVYWGWNGIQGLLYKAGSFADLCDDDPNPSFIKLGQMEYIDCGARKSAINNLFTIAYSAQLMSSIFTGMVLDYIGPKFCFMVGQFSNFISWILISSMPKNPQVLRFCFLLIGCTTESLYMPLTTVSHYFPSNQSLILSIMGSTRSISILIPIFLSFIFNLPYFKPEDLYKIGIGYAVVCNLSCFFIGALIIQRKFYLVDYGYESDKLDREMTRIDEIDNYKQNEIKEISCFNSLSNLRTIYKHPRFLEFILLLIITSLFLSAIEFINKSHRDLLVTTSGKSAADIFKYIHVVSFVPGPLIGYFMDMFGAPVIYVFIQLSCLLYFLCSLTDYYCVKVVACLFFLFSCSLCVSDTYCYIRQRFSPLHFGVLNGVCFLAAGLFSLTNIPLYDLGAKKLTHLAPNNFRPVVMILIAYMVLCILISVTLVCMTKTPRYYEESEKSSDS